MAQRRHHYEAAFEEYLRARRVPYVAVDEAKKALLPDAARLAFADGNDAQALKSFDFVLYGQGENILAEVKGRSFAESSATSRATTRRLESWVTLEDVRSLSRWEQLFGTGFAAAFVFVYACAAQPPDALFQEVFEHRGRWYAVRAVRVRDYAASMHTRSTRWGTVHLSADAFERLSSPLCGSAPYPLPDLPTLGSSLLDPEYRNGTPLPVLAPFGD